MTNYRSHLFCLPSHLHARQEDCPRILSYNSRNFKEGERNADEISLKQYDCISKITFRCRNFGRFQGTGSAYSSPFSKNKNLQTLPRFRANCNSQKNQVPISRFLNGAASLPGAAVRLAIPAPRAGLILGKRATQIDGDVLYLFQSQSIQLAMKDVEVVADFQLTQARKHKWKRLFKSRLSRKLSQLTQEASEDPLCEFESDRSSQSTNDIQNNVDYFDFSFIEQ